MNTFKKHLTLFLGYFLCYVRYFLFFLNLGDLFLTVPQSPNPEMNDAINLERPLTSCLCSSHTDGAMTVQVHRCSCGGITIYNSYAATCRNDWLFNGSAVTKH